MGIEGDTYFTPTGFFDNTLEADSVCSRLCARVMCNLTVSPVDEDSAERQGLQRDLCQSKVQPKILANLSLHPWQDESAEEKV